MEKPITYVGLDVHKETISVAVAEGGFCWEVRYFGIIENRPAALRKLAERLGRAGRKLRFCHEAGPCGYGVYRQLTGLGHDCAVVAPSLIPRRPGDRVKTDRRDCLGLAKLDRAGEATLRAAGPSRPAQQIVLEDDIQAVEDAQAKCERLTVQIEALACELELANWGLRTGPWRRWSKPSRPLRGVALITAVTILAVTILAGVGDLTRFHSPPRRAGARPRAGRARIRHRGRPRGSRASRVHRASP